MAKTPEDYFPLALKLNFNPSLGVDEWLAHSRQLAEKMAMNAPGSTYLPPAPPPDGNAQGAAPAAPAVQQRKGNRFGPAFDGWDEVACVQVLLMAQQVVVTREQNGTEEQQEAAETQLLDAVAELQRSRKESRGQ